MRQDLVIGFETQVLDSETDVDLFGFRAKG